MSYHPKTGLVYIPAQQIPQGYLQDMDELDKRKVLGFNVGTSLNKTMLPDDVQAFRAAVAATTGRLVAFDPRTGKVAWGVDYPAAWNGGGSEENTSEHQSLMRIWYAAFRLKKKN